MSTHNICFPGEIGKILCGYPLLSVAMCSSPSYSNKGWKGLTRALDKRVYLLVSPQNLCDGTVNVLKFPTPKCLKKWCMQTMLTQIRLLLKEKSDLGLHWLHFH